jgi:hypothetical protein
MQSWLQANSKRQNDGAEKLGTTEDGTEQRTTERRTGADETEQRRKKLGTTDNGTEDGSGRETRDGGEDGRTRDNGGERRDPIGRDGKMRNTETKLRYETSWMQKDTLKIPENRRNSIETIQAAEKEWANWCSREYVKSNGYTAAKRATSSPVKAIPKE